MPLCSGAQDSRAHPPEFAVICCSQEQSLAFTDYTGDQAIRHPGGPAENGKHHPRHWSGHLDRANEEEEEGEEKEEEEEKLE